MKNLFLYSVTVMVVLLLASCRPGGTKAFDKSKAIEYYMDADTEALTNEITDYFDVMHQDSPLTIGVLAKESCSDFIPYVVTPSGELIHTESPDLDQRQIGVYRTGTLGVDIVDGLPVMNYFKFNRPAPGTYDIFVRSRDFKHRAGPDSIPLYVLVRTNNACTIHKVTVKKHPDELYDMYHRTISVTVTDTVATATRNVYPRGERFVKQYTKSFIKEIADPHLIDLLHKDVRPGAKLQIFLVKDRMELIYPILVVKQPNGTYILDYDPSDFDDFTHDPSTGGKYGGYERGIDNKFGYIDFISWTNPERGKYEIFVDRANGLFYKLAIMDEGKWKVYIIKPEKADGTQSLVLNYER